MTQTMTYGQFSIPAELGDRIGAWQQAWEELYREPISAAELPLDQLRALNDRRHTAAAHLLGMAYVLLSDLADGSTHQSERVTPERMPGGDVYPYRYPTDTTPYDTARGPFEPEAPAPAGAAR